VSRASDDDALSWGGDDDPTLHVAAPPASAETAPQSGVLPQGYSAVGRGSDGAGGIAADERAEHADDASPLTAPTEDAAEGPTPMPASLLVTLGIVAGVYLLYTIGWLVGGLRLQGTAQFLVSPVGYTIALWLAVAAPALWFLTVYLLTRGAKTWLRVLWLVAGLALLIPWPFVMVGAVGGVA